MNSLRSVLVSIAPGIAVKKLGHPVLLSYFMSDLNSGSPQPAQANTPLRYSVFSGLVKRRSVPSSRSTWYCSGVRSWRHCVSGLSMCPMLQYSSAISTLSCPLVQNSEMPGMGCYVISDNRTKRACGVTINQYHAAIKTDNNKKTSYASVAFHNRLLFQRQTAKFRCVAFAAPRFRGFAPDDERSDQPFEQLHVHGRAGRDVALVGGQDDEAIGLAHRGENSRTLVAGGAHAPLIIRVA